MLMSISVNQWNRTPCWKQVSYTFTIPPRRIIRENLASKGTETKKLVVERGEKSEFN